MACRLVGAKPLSESMLEYCQLNIALNKLQWKLNRNSYNFIQEDAFENVVCEMAAILSRPQCVNESVVIEVCTRWSHNRSAPIGNGFGAKPLPETTLKKSVKTYGVFRTQWIKTHWGRDKTDTLQRTFSSMKMFEFRLKIHWSLFLRVQLTIFQHWFR